MDNSSAIYKSEMNSYFCPPTDDAGGTEYHNDMTTILFNPQEVATQLLFHLKGEARNFLVQGYNIGVLSPPPPPPPPLSLLSDEFTLSTLWIVFVLYFLITCWTLGTAVSSGLFIPSIVTGALYGLLIITFFE